MPKATLKKKPSHFMNLSFPFHSKTPSSFLPLGLVDLFIYFFLDCNALPFEIILLLGNQYNSVSIWGGEIFGDAGRFDPSQGPTQGHKAGNSRTESKCLTLPGNLSMRPTYWVCRSSSEFGRASHPPQAFSATSFPFPNSTRSPRVHTCYGVNLVT